MISFHNILTSAHNAERSVFTVHGVAEYSPKRGEIKENVRLLCSGMIPSLILFCCSVLNRQMLECLSELSMFGEQGSEFIFQFARSCSLGMRFLYTKKSVEDESKNKGRLYKKREKLSVQFSQILPKQTTDTEWLCERSP